ncbi:hypothetical protein CAAN3_05S06370 [[Candida] anglica]
MDYMQESNLYCPKVFSDISLDSTMSETSQSTYNQTPKTSSKFWQPTTNNNSLGQMSKPFMLPFESNQPNTNSTGSNTTLTRSQSMSNQQHSGIILSPQTTQLSQPLSTPNSKYSMNLNAPSYVPLGSSRSYSFSGSAGLREGSEYLNSTDNYTYQTSNYDFLDKNSLSSTRNSKNFNDDLDLMRSQVQSLQIELNLQTQVASSLTEQLNSVNALEQSNNTESTYGSTNIPSNYLFLFEDLKKRYDEQTKELDATKERLEAIITASTMNPSKSRTFNGEYNEEEIAHKIVTMLAVLRSENDNLLKMVTMGNKSTFLIEIGLLRDENEQLKAQINSSKQK